VYATLPASHHGSCEKADAVIVTRVARGPTARRRQGAPFGGSFRGLDIPTEGRVSRALASRTAALVVLAALGAGVYAPNLRDYFIGDDFDLIGSFTGRPASYFLRLLVDNASGDVWKDWGLDAASGRGFLRPLPMWLLKLDSVIWGTEPLGFRLAATAAFVALVLQVFLILEALGARRSSAFLAAWGVAVHPVMAAIVPFVAAREETLTTAFALASFYCFLKVRQSAASIAPVLVFYALALLTKETAVVWIALPLGYDAACGAFTGGAAADRRRMATFYGGLIALLGCYLGLRWIAFGNVVGGDGRPTRYSSPSALLAYHAQLWTNLAGPRLFDSHRVPALGWVAILFALAVVALAFRRAGAGSAWSRRALFFGPYWYLCGTALFYGTYYDDRHHSLPIVGLALFLGLATDVVTETLGRVARAACLGGALLVVTAVWLPAALRNAREFHEASLVTARVREAIETLTAGLPDGAAVRLVHTPLQGEPPFYFGWGLQSALKRPFTPSDAAKRLRIVDSRDLALNGRATLMPRRFDLEIRFRERPPGTIEWVR
jgi:hypothetical protein